MSDRPTQRRRINPNQSLFHNPPVERSANLRFFLEDEEVKFQTLINKDIKQTYHLQPSRMHHMKQWLEYIVPIQWRRVFMIDCIPYRELVLEFFSTYSFFPNISDIDYPTIIFRLRGEMRAISLRQFALRLGIYTDDEINQGGLGMWHEISDKHCQDLWRGLVNYKDFKVAYIVDSRLRILYQTISAALFGYQEIIGNLEHSDLTIMHSFMEKQFLCPALYIAKACVEKFPGDKETLAICGGKIVTKLAESFGLLTADFTSTLQPVGRVFTLDIRSYKSLGALDEPNHKSLVLVHDASPDDSPAQEIEPEASNLNDYEQDVYRPLSEGEMEPWTIHPGASSSHPVTSYVHQDASSSNPVIPSPQLFQEPMFDFSPEFSFDNLIREISHSQTFYPGESSSNPVVISSPQQEQPPPPKFSHPSSYDDLVNEVHQLKNNQEKIMQQLSEILDWIKNHSR